jgi:hypothetical protein
MSQVAEQTRARQVFHNAAPAIQTAIKEILRHERELMHLLRRADIHQRIYDVIRKVAK